MTSSRIVNKKYDKQLTCHNGLDGPGIFFYSLQKTLEQFTCTTLTLRSGLVSQDKLRLFKFDSLLYVPFFSGVAFSDRPLDLFRDSLVIEICEHCFVFFMLKAFSMSHVLFMTGIIQSIDHVIT